MFPPPAPFSPVSSAQLAVAALFGASVMAISAFYIHKRSVDQVLDRLLNIRNRRHLQQLSDDEECDLSDFNENAETDKNVIIWRSESKLLSSEDGQNKDGYSDEARDYRVSCSMPNASTPKIEWRSEESGADIRISNSLGKIDSIPTDLPPLRTYQRDGMFSVFFN